MTFIEQNFSVPFSYKVFFTKGLFDPDNTLFADFVQPPPGEHVKKVLFVFDEGMLDHHPGLFEKIRNYARHYPSAFSLIEESILLPGGEAAKNDPNHIRRILDAINRTGLDRHSYVAAIGGGAVIDAAGYAAAIAHRGVRLIRVPTTVLAQNDASVGVKNGVNTFGKKNFLGTFVPPAAVMNDFEFLKTLDRRDWVSGIAEAVKVALLKDGDFFDFIERRAPELHRGEEASMQHLIRRCAELHLEHISTSGDPFEMGSSRPLDFGHWAAHKLEQLTNYELRHGEAVAIGLALDVTYSLLENRIEENDWKRILDVLKNSGFSLYVPQLNSRPDTPEHPDSIFRGLEEFREHLGGQLTIMLLEGIGQGVEVHKVDYGLYRKAIGQLEEIEKQPVS